MKFETTTQPTAQSTNLVDLMDGFFRLYAPIVRKLLEDYPKAHGVHTFIGRDDPTAIPENAEGQGYGLKSFEKRASKELGKLVQQTMDLQESCPITKGKHEPVNVIARRLGDEIVVQVTVSNRLGGIHARRVGQCDPAAIDAFFLLPPEIIITVGSEEAAKMEAVKSACAHGIAEGVEAAIATDTVLNWNADEAEAIRDWLDQFPNDGTAKFKPYIAHFSRITVESDHKPILIMAPVTSYEAVKAKFSRNVVEPIEYEAPARVPTP